MKKIGIIFLLSIIISIMTLGVVGGNKENPAISTTSEYLRIHIRADSNAQDDQSVKYLVRDELVAYLTPLVAEFETKDEAIVGVGRRLKDLEIQAEKVLQANGFFYGASVELKKEKFPTRIYGEYTLPAGEYAALIVRLGRGNGDNWWCVVYPPLCFAGETGQNIIYKSKIQEIIQNWKQN